ncbi:nuclear transport factor 2 family protein [Nonomuraea turkmeniaca]|uniref:Nuclear transport factor 2 family protein n=1 Tax=Nonomuraea turkmeniaca TaxID=103838 RepID=A0A5S4FFF1_9ACTN|nr:nuclear transport factor 2 family protein [Nonomuraea turkmeniaca]TMR16749.1 nuclear transport factor 2 family protein [Nonomuraea turkmeniaca]
MSKISQRRALLMAAIIPAMLVAGCAAGGSGTQAMKGAAASPTDMPTDMPTDDMMSPEETDTASPTGTDTASPTDTAGGADQPRSAVQGFFDALKSGNVDQVVGAFADDAVVAVDGEATAKGTQAIRTLFQGQLDEMKQATHTIEEDRTLGSEDAVVRATSKQGGDNLRELFLLSQDGGEWKISQFMNNQAG